MRKNLFIISLLLLPCFIKAESSLQIKNFTNTGGTLTCGKQKITGYFTITGGFSWFGKNIFIAPHAEVRGKFGDSNLTGAKFIDVDLREVDFETSDLTEADFSGADLTDAKLMNAVVMKAIFKTAKGLTEEQKKDLKNRGAIID